jgi:PsbP-like protein
LPLLLSSFISYNIERNIPLAKAQQDNASFLTYTNPDLGFTIKYPSDWTVNDSNNMVNGHKVASFTSADRVGIVFVQAENATQGEIAVCNMNDSAKTNTIRTHLTPGERLIELDVTRYLLSGHPAIRIIETQSFGGPGQPISFKPYDAKGMIYSVVLGEKFYKVAYMVTPPERFPIYLQTAQSMIDSFQIINKQ